MLSSSSLRHPRLADVHGPGVPARPRRLPAEGGPQREPGLQRPLQHDAHRGAQPLPRHSAAGCAAHEPSRRTGVHPPGRQRRRGPPFIMWPSSASVYAARIMTRELRCINQTPVSDSGIILSLQPERDAKFYWKLACKDHTSDPC